MFVYLIVYIGAHKFTWILYLAWDENNVPTIEPVPILSNALDFVYACKTSAFDWTVENAKPLQISGRLLYSLNAWIHFSKFEQIKNWVSQTILLLNYFV